MACSNDGTNIFSNSAGRAVVIDGDALPLTFTVDGDAELFSDLKAVVTSVGIQAQGGYQFMHTLRELIYIYVFTERVGEIVVSGIVFPEVCGSQGPQEDPDNCIIGDTGLERVLRWYECNRITTRALPINITFGNALTYEAFLVGANAQITDASSGIAQFTYRFNYIPHVDCDEDFCFELDEACLDDIGPQGPQEE